MKKALYSLGILILLASATAYATSIWEKQSAQAYAGAKLDDDLVTGTIDLAATSAQYTLPGTVGRSAYMICARGNRAYILCGASPTVAATAGSYTFSVPDGSCVGPLRLTGPKCAHIAATAAGQVEFLHIDSRL